MRVCALIVLFGTICGYCSGQTTAVVETSTDLPMIIAETEIERNASGYCKFELKKRQIFVVPVHYTEIETYYGRCRGYYFKKCMNERPVQKVRFENRIREVNDTVERCCDGYASNPDKDKCLPVCENNCVYSSCTAPNVCSCYQGYEATNKSNVCQPKCIGCTHGSCIAPNVCACNAGYNWDSEATECVPVCTGMCHNGKCIAPEQCVCNAGYIHHATHSVCVPFCNETCVYGQCLGANKCECDFGYQFANGSQSVCEPICEMSCKNAKCVTPNVCECHNGYSVLDDDKPHECHCGQYCVEIDGMCHCLDDGHRINGDVIRNNMSSICTESTCANGVCLTLYDCECYDGFEKDENFNCVAVNETCIDDPNICNGTEIKTCNCINGICAANFTCVCVNGFKMSDGHSDLCEPKCTKECVNGFCINPDECECDNGYRLGYNESETYICHPICDPEAEDNNGCVNGTCIAPDTCQCYEGFKLSNESNFTCVFDPFYAERQTAKIHWLLPAVSLTAILIIALLAITFVNNKRKLRNYNMPTRDDEASEPIADYVNDDL